MLTSNMDLHENDMIQPDFCYNCGETTLILDECTGETVCGECGCVVQDITLNRGPEWRAFKLKEKFDRQRASPIQSIFNEIGFNTSFQTNSDSSGRKLDSKTRSKMFRLKRHDTRSKLVGRARNLSEAMNILSCLADELHLPSNVRRRATRIYYSALRRDLIRGRTIAGFVAASVYAACREAKVPRSLKEISLVSSEDLKDISRVYRLLIRNFDLKMPVDHPMKFVPRIAEELDIGRETDRLCIELLCKAKQEKMLVGKDPRGMAAAALYLACKITDEQATQKDIAHAAGTTEVTLRNRLKDLEKMENLDQLFARASEILAHRLSNFT